MHFEWSVFYVATTAGLHASARLCFLLLSWYIMLAGFFMWLFMLQRARMVAMIPHSRVIPERCFTCLLPLLLLGLCIFMSAGAATHDPMKSVCDKFDGASFCRTQSKIDILQMILVAVFESSIAIFLLYLFVNPMLFIYREDHQLRPQVIEKVKQNIRWNISMSALNMGSSIFVLVTYPLNRKFEYVHPIDTALNVMTIFLMLDENRQWLYGKWRTSKQRLTAVLVALRKHLCPCFRVLSEITSSESSSALHVDINLESFKRKSTKCTSSIVKGQKLSQINEYSAEVMPSATEPHSRSPPLQLAQERQASPIESSGNNNIGAN